MKKCTSFRLRNDQIQYLKKNSGCNTLLYIITRYIRGDFNNYINVTQNEEKIKNTKNVLQIYSYRGNTYNISSEFMRKIIDLHIKYKDKYLELELKKADDELKSLMKCYCNNEYIIEKEME